MDTGLIQVYKGLEVVDEIAKVKKDDPKAGVPTMDVIIDKITIYEFGDE